MHKTYCGTLPHAVKFWFEIHDIYGTIPGDHFLRLSRINRESFDLLLNVIRRELVVYGDGL